MLLYCELDKLAYAAEKAFDALSEFVSICNETDTEYQHVHEDELIDLCDASDKLAYILNDLKSDRREALRRELQ